MTKHRKGERLAKSICGRRAVMAMLTGAVFLTGCGEAGGPSGVAEVPDSGGSQSQDAGTLPLGTAIHAKSIAVAVHHACAVLDDGRVACWGTNEWGQLGDGAKSVTPGFSETSGAVVVPGLMGAARVVTGSGGVCLENGTCILADTTCALLGDQTARCWGNGAHGELGNERQGRDYFEASPVALKLSGIVDLALNGGTGCAVLEDGSVSCWGANAGNELGFTSPSCGPFWGFATDTVPPPMPSPCETSPRSVPGIQDAIQVTVGGSHQCVVHRDASATCWGSNAFGELGDGSAHDVSNGHPVPGDPIAHLSVSQIAAGSHHTCAVLQDGTVDCWGSNDSGQLGQGNTNIQMHQEQPIAVPGIANVQLLSLTDNTNVATLADGTGSAWGDVSYVFKETPDPGSAAIGSPTKMTWITDTTALDTGHFTTCALQRDKTVSCWSPTEDPYQVRFRDP